MWARLRRSKMSRLPPLPTQFVEWSYQLHGPASMRPFFVQILQVSEVFSEDNFDHEKTIALMFSKGKTVSKIVEDISPFAAAASIPVPFKVVICKAPFRLWKFANFLGRSCVFSFSRVGFKIFGHRRPLPSIWKDDCLETVARPFAGKCAHQEGQRYPVFWKCFSLNSVCEVVSCRAFFGWFAEFPLWQACLLCKKIMHIHLRIRWSRNLDQLVRAKKRIRIRRGAWPGRSSLANYEEVCPRPWTFRGKDAKSGGGKGIKRSARDYVCSKRFGTMTASAFYEKPFDRKPPLTKNIKQLILRIAFGAPRRLKKPLPWECFSFLRRGKRLARKSEMFKLLYSCCFEFASQKSMARLRFWSVRKSQALRARRTHGKGKSRQEESEPPRKKSWICWTKDRCFTWNTAPSSRSLYSFKVFT